MHIEAQKKRTLNILCLILIILYSAFSPLFYVFKIFSTSAYDYSEGEGIYRKVYFSVLDSMDPNNSWLIIISVIVNVLLLVLSTFLLFNKKENYKKALFYSVVGFYAISLLFFILTIVIGTSNPMNALPLFAWWRNIC